MFTEKEMQSIQKLLAIINDSSLRSGTLEKEGILINFNKDSSSRSHTSVENIKASDSTAHLDNQDTQPTMDSLYNTDDIECNAPFLGTLHLQNNNGSKEKIHIGQRVKKGEVLFSIEAMKLLNDVHAPANGEIVDILFEHGELVQYGEVIIRLRACDMDD